MKRQREQHYASHYHWIQLHFYPGPLAKLIKTGQQWNTILNSEISLSDSVWNVTGVFFFLSSRFLYKSSQLSWQEVIWSCHLVTPGCSGPHTFSKKHISPLIIPSCLVSFWCHFASPMESGQVLRDHSNFLSFTSFQPYFLLLRNDLTLNE